MGNCGLSNRVDSGLTLLKNIEEAETLFYNGLVGYSNKVEFQGRKFLAGTSSDRDLHVYLGILGDAENGGALRVISTGTTKEVQGVPTGYIYTGAPEYAPKFPLQINEFVIDVEKAKEILAIRLEKYTTAAN